MIRIHSRNIAIDTYELGEDRLLIEGSLRDDRFFPSYFYSARKFADPGVIHLIVVRFTVTLPRLLITEAEARMEAVPNEICREVRDTIRNLEGLRIHRGFRSELTRRMGGKTGCLHMTNLVLAMASAAVQGQWAYYSRIREEGTVKSPKIDPSLLIDSCWLWREGGPFYERILKMEEEGREENKTD